MTCHAFTLSELLMSVLVISIMLVAMAPVITRRITDNVTVANAKYDWELFLYNVADPNCHFSTEDSSSIVCPFTPPAGVNEVNLVMVSGGGGGAGATAQAIQTISHTIDSATAATDAEIPITTDMRDLNIAFISGAGGGGGGGAWDAANEDPIKIESQADCNKAVGEGGSDGTGITNSAATTLFVPSTMNASSGKSICVTKYNVGDTSYGGPPIQVTQKSYTDGVRIRTNCNEDSYSDYCCWTNQFTSQISTCSQTGTFGSFSSNYNACNRTVCTWYSADESCRAWAPTERTREKWRLPKTSEMNGWANQIAYETSNSMGLISQWLGDTGLQLCDYSSTSSGSLRCNYLSGGCPGSNVGNCSPYGVWSSTPNGSSYYRYYLYSGTFNSGSTSPRYAFSARCVLEEDSRLFNSFGAGAGGGAPFISQYQIPQSVINANVGGKIVVVAGVGGAGGAAATQEEENATDGSDGTATTISIQNPEGVLVWSLTVPGGKGGEAASGSDFGQGGAQISETNACTLFENGVTKAINCSGYGPKGENGTSSSGTFEIAGKGGTGGGSKWITTLGYEGGGSGGTFSNPNGSVGERYGAGGGGGTIFIENEDNITKGKGGDGRSGVVSLSYKSVYPAAAGGGGGGGAFARITDIPVEPQVQYQITIGGGGAGGAVSGNGTNGGKTSVTFGDVTYTLLGGGGGLVGTGVSSAVNTLVQGLAGEGGDAEGDFGEDIEVFAGENGTDAISDTLEMPGYTFDVSAGGMGGISGINTPGGCGGMLFDEDETCTNDGVHGRNLPFMLDGKETLYETSEFGSAGSGGGGGGWAQSAFYSEPSGSGAAGQNGYVYIWWIRQD